MSRRRHALVAMRLLFTRAVAFKVAPRVSCVDGYLTHVILILSLSLSCPATFAPSWDEARALLPREVLRDILWLGGCYRRRSPTLVPSDPGHALSCPARSLLRRRTSTGPSHGRATPSSLRTHWAREPAGASLMVDCVPVARRGQAHPLSPTSSLASALLARPPLTLAAAGIDHCEPSLSSVRSGMANGGLTGHPARGLSVRELDVACSLEDGACSGSSASIGRRHHVSDTSEEPCSGARLRRRRLGEGGRAPRASGLRPFARARGSGRTDGRRAATHCAALSPVAIEAFGRAVGLARRASSRPFSDSDRRASGVDGETTMRRGSGTASPRARGQSERAAHAPPEGGLGVASRDMSLQGLVHGQSCL